VLALSPADFSNFLTDEAARQAPCVAPLGPAQTRLFAPTSGARRDQISSYFLHQDLSNRFPLFAS
jgi:hypothetical protein